MTSGAPRHPFGKRKRKSAHPLPSGLRDEGIRYASREVKTPLVKACAILGLTGAVVGIGLMTSSRGPTAEMGCVDQHGVVVSDKNCEQNTYPYRWHYGGRSYHIGSPVFDGTYNRPTGYSFFRPNSPSQRGVFGGSGRFFSSVGG